MNNAMRMRIKEKLFNQFIKSDIRLGRNNNKIVLRCDSKGRIFKYDVHGRRYVSIDDKTFPMYEVSVYDGSIIYENQHYNKSANRKKIIVDSNGIAYTKYCKSCGDVGDIFNKGRTICRDCQSKTKKEYRQTDGFKHSNDRRIRRMRATDDGTITNKSIRDMYRKQNGCCNMCNKKLNGLYHKDHIHPISKGGAHSITNIQLLCISCNLSKSDKIIA